MSQEIDRVCEQIAGTKDPPNTQETHTDHPPNTHEPHTKHTPIDAAKAVDDDLGRLTVGLGARAPGQLVDDVLLEHCLHTCRSSSGTHIGVSQAHV